MTAREQYDAMVRDAVWPHLRERGFKRAKNTFRRRNEASWEVINFQSSQASMSHHVRFTVNLGVALDLLRRPEHEGKTIQEYHCGFLNTRLGWLLPDRVPWDWWWIADHETDYERLGADLAASLLERGIPWLEARATPEGVRDVWMAEIDEMLDHQLKEVLKVVSVTGPAEAREDVEAMLRWRSTPDGRAELYKKHGELQRARPRPDAPALIYTRVRE